MSTPSPAGSVRSRLQAALRAAMKERDTVTASALRSALSAIANAEAVSLPAASSGPPARPAAQSSPHFAGAVAGLGAAEVSRRQITEDEATAIAAAEAADRRAAARDYQAAGHADRAGRLRREARAIEAALDITPPRDDA
jgi:uncharacterized protein YqeY